MSSWSRAKSSPFGQDHPAQPANASAQSHGFGGPAFSAPASSAPAFNAPAFNAPAFGAPVFGAPAYGSNSAFGAGVPAQGPQARNPFQQHRQPPQAPNWLAPPSAANGHAFTPGSPWPNTNTPHMPASAFSTNQPFSAHPGSAFTQNKTDSATSQPNFPSVPPFGEPASNAFQQQSLPSHAQKQPQSAFTSVLSSAAPSNTAVSVLPGDKGAKSGQRSQNSKRQARKEQTEGSTKSQAGSETVSKPRKGPKEQHTSTQFPRFPPTSFPARTYTPSDDKTILKPLPKPLAVIQERKDSWDQKNQMELEQIEHEYLDGRRSLQDAYDSMNSMRDKERQEMESRGLVDNAQARKSLDDAIAFVGSCTDMCPVYERIRRALENNAFSWEKGVDGKVIASRAVKAFARPAAGNPPALPSDVRPPSVLVNTLRYLVADIVPQLPESHSFVWDRTRSIRQDFTFQNFQGPEATWCFEVIARIHIVCLHAMARAAAAGAEWSQQQELEQFNKCLQSLSEFYQQNSTENEPEMRAYGILSHLFDEELVASVDRLPLRVSRHPLVLLASELRALATTSITEFFVRVRKEDVPAMFRAVLEIHFNELRVRAARNLTNSMHPRTNAYPFKRFAAILGFESEEQARHFCDFYDLTLSTSDEAGEEIDVKAWSEDNVRDKRPMTQAFDYSLDALIDQVDVTKSVSLKPSKDQTDQGSFARLLKQQKPKFNVTAPSFTPTTNPGGAGAAAKILKHPPSFAAADLPSRESLGAATLGPAQSGQPYARPNAAPEAFKSKFETAIHNGGQQRASPKPSQNTTPNPQNKIFEAVQVERQQPEPGPAPLVVPDDLILKVFKNAATNETTRVLERAQKVVRRNRFVDVIAHRVLESLLQSVSSADAAMTLKAVEFDKKRLGSFAVSSIKHKAALALQRKREKEQNQQELQLFWSRPSSRVVSLSRTRPSPTPSSQPLQKTSPLLPKPEERGDYPHEEVQEDDSDELSEQLSYLPLIPLMRKAFSSGFSSLAIIVDPLTSQGTWIQRVVGTDEIAVEVLPGRTVRIHVLDHLRSGYNASLSGQGASGQHCKVWRDISGVNTLVDLERALRDVLNDWLTWHERDLLNYRSLNVVNVKRRRVSRPSSGCHDQTYTSSSESLSQARNSFAAQTSERARLRALVADARSMMK